VSIDNTVRDAFARDLCARICDGRRTEDELRVLDDVLCGIERGADTIGPMDLAADSRDFDEEAAQECRDLLVYLSMRKVAEQHRRLEGLRRAAALELDQLDETAPRPKSAPELPPTAGVLAAVAP
jgi:hypothetical protein